MIYGYARVSTESQDLAAQIDRLKGAGCERIFHEKRSGKNADRAQLQRMLKALEAGDTVLATVTDRIARDPLDMLNILNSVKAAGAGLRLLDEPFIDTTSEMSDIIIFVVGWAAKWQRRRILENTTEGRARAKARGVKFGRKRKLTRHQEREALARVDAGELLREVARSYNVSHSTISRLRNA
ncbi:recombinase family protein [Mesorhizobium sp. M0478]|uniref:recombinase family protein n=1 Tax=Mesorhizobium sp. M0478 TaxID=2956947 RepID=UPI00333ACE53